MDVADIPNAELEAGSGSLPRRRSQAQPRPARERRRAVPGRVGARGARPAGPLAAVVLGLVATVFLVRMYSLFHDLTHNSLFESRAANSRWGHVLGYLLFTPYRWWQRQHSLHHAHAGNLDHRGIGEIYTMTVAEYERASLLRRLGYRAYRNPVLMLLVGPEPGVPVRAPLPPARHVAADPAQRRGHEPGAGRLGGGLERGPGGWARTC